jgi:hypothetical protein
LQRGRGSIESWRRTSSCPGGWWSWLGPQGSLVTAGSGETRRRRTGRLWERGPLHHGQETAPYKGAAASSCTPADAEVGATPQTSTGARDRGGAGDGPVGKGRARPSANAEAPRRGPDPEAASVRATLGEGAALGWHAARKPSGRSISQCPGSDAFNPKILN